MKKLALFLTLLGCMESTRVSAVCLEKTVTYTVSSQPLKTVLQDLEKLSGCYFSYSDDVIPVNRPITVSAVSKPLKQVLEMVLKGTGINFAEQSDHVIFYRKKSSDKKKFTLSGFVTEQESGEALIGVNIYFPALASGTTTNNYGFYSITLASDSLEVIYSYVGFQDKSFRIFLDKDITLNVEMYVENVLKEVVVKDQRKEKISENVQMSVIELPVQQIKDIPALLGEKDVLKVIQLLPGVQKGSEGQSGFYVRGGGPDQNLIILDDATVYNAFHLFGFFSLFNGDALKTVELTKGGFPARFGGRLSSVVEMSMKDGNQTGYHGEGGIGAISSRLTLEGPIVKGKSSFLVSGRRTYVDVLMKPFMDPLVKAGYYFYDLNAKVNYEIDDKNKIYLSGYFGRDRFYVKDDGEFNDFRAGLEWGNGTGTLRWNHLFSNKLFSNISAIYSDYKMNVWVSNTFDKKEFSIRYGSGIRDVQLKGDFDYYFSEKHHIRFGASAIWHHFTPSVTALRDDFSGRNEEVKEVYEAFESGLYFEDEMKLSSRMKINAGLRLSNFGRTYQFLLRPEPRITGRYMLKHDLSVKACYSIMNQYIHLLSNTGIGLPTDLWVPSTERIRHQHSQQVAAGIAKDLKYDITLSVDGYYKDSRNVIGYKEGATFIQVEDDPTAENISWEDNVTSGRGKSYGAELMLQRKKGKFTGWIGYTLSWTILQFDEINEGKPYYARYDRRHDLSLVGIYKLNDNITFSATWVYGTGNAITPPLAEYTAPVHIPSAPQPIDLFNGYVVTDYGDRNSVRMPAYHRLDIAVGFHKKLKRFERTLELSVYNVYNQQNPFFYYIATDFNGQDVQRKLKQITLFPMIPSISYNFKF